MDASGVEEKGEREKFELQSKLVATQNEVMELEMQQKARHRHRPRPPSPRHPTPAPARRRPAPWSALGRALVCRRRHCPTDHANPGGSRLRDRPVIVWR